MSELSIDAEHGADLDCEVGDTITVSVTGRVTSKTPDGGKTIAVDEVSDYEHGAEEPAYEEAKPKGKRHGKSAVMIMLGK